MDIKVETTKNGRFYTVDGRRYVSVTTPFNLISAPFLKVWEAKVGKTKAQRVGIKAQTYGNTIHDYCDNILQGKEFTPKKRYVKIVEEIKKWVDKNVKNVIASEAIVWSDTDEVAGRIDAVLEMKDDKYGGYIIADWKSGRVKHQHMMQLAMYKEALLECHNEIGVSLKRAISGRMILNISESGIKEYVSSGSKLIDGLFHDDTSLDLSAYLCLLDLYKKSMNFKYPISLNSIKKYGEIR